MAFLITRQRLLKISGPALIWISPLIMAWMALFIGAYGIHPMDVLRCFIPNGEFNPQAQSIVINIRLPRILLAGLVGMALATSGTVLQGIFRNPLVDPFILGLSAGAALGCAVATAWFPEAPLQPFTFIFSISAVALAWFMARTQGELSRVSLVLAGIVVSAFFTALVSTIKFMVDPNKLVSIVYWLMGSFALADWPQVRIAAVGIVISLLPVFLMRWRLNVLSMGEIEARTLGVNVRLYRLIFIVASTLAVSIAVSVSGIIGWVGLMAPHIIRMLIGPDHSRLIPLSMAGGAAFMIAADTLSRNLTQYDLPVGIITSLLGAPFFIFLLKRSGRQNW